VARYAAGQPVRLSTTVKDTAGVLTDPGDISVQIKDSITGTVTIYDYNPGAIVRDSVGAFHLDLSGLTAGLYPGAWVTTGTAAGIKSFLLNVVDPLLPSHLDFSDVRARLNISGLSDSEIEDMMASAVQEQENRVGPVAPRAVTGLVVYPSFGGVLLLPAPVVSLTSLTPAGGTALDLGSLDLSKLPSGIVRPAYGSGGLWAPYYTAALVAGRNPVPQDLVEAALLRVAHSYATQRGGSAGVSRIIGGASEDIGAGPDGSDFLLMLRAEAKEAPYLLPAVA
jgi:hypothetical protein